MDTISSRGARGLMAALVAATTALACATDTLVFEPFADGLKPDGQYRLRSDIDLIRDHKTRNEDGTVNVIVEIPAGTNQKWEVEAGGRALIWEFTGEVPRVVDYLPYPGNYGMIPRTLLDESQGGDGQPLDVLVLGPAVPRGSLIQARPIGIIRVLDRAEQDDKILAVLQDSTFDGVTSTETLDLRFPGATEILRTWWTNAHGKRGRRDVKVLAVGSRGQAMAVIDYAARTFEDNK